MQNTTNMHTLADDQTIDIFRLLIYITCMFWTYINQLDLIVPTTPDGLCDCDIHGLESDSDIHGIDAENDSINKYKNEKQNSEINEMLCGMIWYE